MLSYFLKRLAAMLDSTCVSVPGGSGPAVGRVLDVLSSSSLVCMWIRTGSV